MTGLSLLVLLANSAVAAPPQTAAAPVRQPKYVMAVEEGKVVCRREAVAESRIPIRICRTELQWEEMARENQQDLRSSRHKRL